MFKVMLSVIGLFLLTSCATITKGSTQLITINCNVTGAHVFIDGVEIGVTPFVGEIKKNQKMLTIEMDGYQNYSVALSKNLEGMFWGNIITGGTIGSMTDFSSGAAYAYAPASYHVELIGLDTGYDEFEKQLKLKKFAMINISNIALDLSNKDGQYLNSLFSLAGIENNDASVQMVLDNLNQAKGNQVVFANLMCENL